MSVLAAEWVPRARQLAQDLVAAGKLWSVPWREAIESRSLRSSSSMPGLMTRMLETLHVRDGDRVLEIGTGTGYNAALLAHRVGDANVFSVDVEPDLVELARRRLARIGYHPTLVVTDGAAGLPEYAPFDRIIATCSVPAVPWTWVEQTSPGGVILIDLKPALGAGSLVRLTPLPQPRRGALRCDLRTVGDGSWAEVTLADDHGTYRVTEGGHRRVWAIIEDAHTLWTALGQPGWDRFGLTVTQDHQRVWLDTPTSAHTWPLTSSPAAVTSSRFSRVWPSTPPRATPTSPESHWPTWRSWVADAHQHPLTTRESTP